MKFDICVPMKEKRPIDFDIPYNRILISTAPSIPEARNELMKKVKTDWFWFIDDDIEVNMKWYNKIIKHIDNEKIGAIGGYGLTKNIFINFIRFLLVRVRGTKDQKGFTSNTLIRRKAVKDIKLTQPYNEDLELKQKIEKKGYIWLQTNAKCLHKKPAKKVIKDSWKYFKKIVREEGLWKAIMRI